MLKIITVAERIQIAVNAETIIINKISVFNAEIIMSVFNAEMIKCVIS
jgi:hypothetical protein